MHTFWNHPGTPGSRCVTRSDSDVRGRYGGSFIDVYIALIIYAGMAFYNVVEPLMAPQSTVNSGQH